MLAFLLVVLGLGLLFLIFRSYLFRLRQKWFAVYMSKFAAHMIIKINPHKQKLFKCMKDIVSHDSKLKEKKKIKILEIGAGSGTNLQFYPDGSHLTMLDLNAEFEDKLRENLVKFPALKLERIVICDAVDMKDIKSGSVDVVVSTFVLCSVSSVAKVLDEIQRVLVPGGKYYFMEKGNDKSRSFRSIIQKILSASRVWPTLFCGCDHSRDIGKSINQAGFQSVHLENFYPDLSILSHFVFYFRVKSLISGVAVK